MWDFHWDCNVQNNELLSWHLPRGPLTVSEVIGVLVLGTRARFL
ncbi:MAG: hypothetical protein U0T85_06545 [Cloacibacterium normanense]